MRIDIEKCNDIELLRQEAYRMKSVIKSLVEDSIDTKFEKVTRLEVIDNKGRQYVQWGIKDIELSLQDFEKTLKLFVSY